MSCYHKVTHNPSAGLYFSKWALHPFLYSECGSELSFEKFVVGQLVLYGALCPTVFLKIDFNSHIRWYIGLRAEAREFLAREPALCGTHSSVYTYMYLHFSLYMIYVYIYMYIYFREHIYIYIYIYDFYAQMKPCFAELVVLLICIYIYISLYIWYMYIYIYAYIFK